MEAGLAGENEALSERIKEECDSLLGRVSWFERNEVQQVINEKEHSNIQKEVVRVRQALENTKAETDQIMQ